MELMEPDISSFKLEILRKDRLQELSKTFPEADAFQRLCYDLLDRDFKDRNIPFRLSLFPTEGRDGSVDISGEDEHQNKLIIECKKNESPESAGDALKALKKKLKENLEKQGAKNTKYSPWFKTRLKKYMYCTSCCFDDDHQRDGFEEEIKKMLLELGVLRTELEHLKEVAKQGVLLYSWNELKPILIKDRFLYHYWIDLTYISGVERLSPVLETNRPLRYDDYLSSSKLDYYSRDEYRTKHPEAGELVTETEILDMLLNQENRYDGCILYGEGGIGKTRLMLELGFRIESQGWIVYKITRYLRELQKLGGLFYPGLKYLLLFDYIEESEVFKPDIAKSLINLCPGAVIKILGNCRKTHIEASELLDAEGFFKENLSIKDKALEKRYEEQVVKHILGDLQRFFRVEKDFYELRPAFAVFLKYLNEKYKTEEEDLDFRNEGAFRLWLKKRLRLTFNEEDYKNLTSQKERFYIFFILSSSREISLSPVSSAETLRSSLGDKVVLPLIRDGWVEKNEKDELRNIHDTIAEEILILRLQDYKDELETEIKWIFDFACQHDSIENCFRLFNRAPDWVHDPKEGKPGEGKKKNSRLVYNLFSKYIMQQPEVCKPLKELLARTTLMDEADIVRLLVEQSAFFEDVIQSLYFGMVLYFHIKHFHKYKERYENEAIRKAGDDIRILLNVWLEVNKDFEEYPFIAARVISAFIEFFGLESGFGKNEEEVGSFARKWLEKFCTTKEANFVIKSWLDGGGEKNIVAPYVVQWLERFPDVMNTSFVLQSWLWAKGEKEIVKDYVFQWLSKYPLEMETSFVIKSWLNAGGEKEVVISYVDPWLKKFPFEIDTHFVIKSWLNARGEKEVVKSYVGPWLAKYPLSMETIFVIQSWLDAKGEKEVVKDYVAPWLKKYPLEIETEFVIQSWLDAGGSPETVKNYINPWLTRFPLEEEITSFVIRAWLRAGGEPEVVEPFVLQWLEEFSNSFEASYVMKALLRQTNDVESIKTYAHKWILAFKDHPQADFVIKRFCRFKDIPADVLDAAVYWCQKYASDSEALFTLSYLTRFHMHSEKLAAPWLLETFSKWITRKKLRKSDHIILENIMFNMSTNETFCHTEESTELSIQWFLSDYSFLPLSSDHRYWFLHRPWYFKRYSRLLIEDRIDISAYQEKVEKFLKWVNVWSRNNKERIRPHLDELNQTLPQYSHL
jgi:hypothetical protein